jgi:hypothetical protein
MLCFNHSTNQAVAICKSCNRGLCAECAVPIGNGIACKDLCEQDVAGLNSTLARNIHAISKGSSAWSAAAGLYLLMGAVFLAWGWSSDLTGILIMGIGFLGYGIFTAIRGRDITRAG